MDWYGVGDVEESVEIGHAKAIIHRICGVDLEQEWSLEDGMTTIGRHR